MGEDFDAALRGQHESILLAAQSGLKRLRRSLMIEESQELRPSEALKYFAGGRGAWMRPWRTKAPWSTGLSDKDDDGAGEFLQMTAAHQDFVPHLHVQVPFAVRDGGGRGYRAFSNRLAAVAAQPELAFGGKYAPRTRQEYAARTGLGCNSSAQGPMTFTGPGTETTHELAGEEECEQDGKDPKRPRRQVKLTHKHTHKHNADPSPTPHLPDPMALPLPTPLRGGADQTGDSEPHQVRDAHQVGDAHQVVDPHQVRDRHQVADPPQVRDPHQVGDAHQVGDSGEDGPSSLDNDGDGYNNNDQD